MSEDESRAERRQRRRERRKKRDSSEEPEVENAEGSNNESDDERKRRRKERRRKKKQREENIDDGEAGEGEGREDDSRAAHRRRRRKKQQGEAEEGGAGGEENEENDASSEKKKKKKKKKRDKKKKGSSDDEDEDGDDATERRTQTTSVAKSKANFDFRQVLGSLVKFTRKFRNPEKPEMPDFKLDFRRVKDPVLMVQMHGTDQLAQDPYVSHPLVKVHIVDSQTGEYIEKEDAQVPSVSLLERQTTIQVNRADGLSVTRSSDSCRHVVPMMTMPCDLGAQGRHGAKLVWDEEKGKLLFGETYKTFLNANVLFLFEVLDFVPGAPQSKLRDGKGWYRIAWAFLHAVGRNGGANIGKTDTQVPKKLRLQLYRHTDQSLASQAHARAWHKSKVTKGGIVPDVFFSYMAQDRAVYPSTIYCTITGVRAPKKARVETPPMHFNQKERHQLSFAQAIAAGEVEPESKTFGGEVDEKAKRVLRRSRGNGEACLVPDTVSARIPCGNGCFALSFSNSGKYLAAACRDDLLYPIRIFEVDSGKSWPWGDFLGHHAIVYTLKWMKGDKMLASASGDGTVRLWMTPSKAWVDQGPAEAAPEAVEADGGLSPRTAQRTAAAEASAQVVTLLHSPPCYVYSAVFHPMADPPVVVSAAFDGNLRVWDARAQDEFSSSKRDRFKGLIKSGIHKTRVNCLTFDKRGLKLFSADANGIVIVWRCHGDMSDPLSYSLLKRVDIMGSKPIHSIDFCREHLLIHAESNILRVVELKKYQQLHDGFSGAQSGSSNIGSCLSPDGRWVLAGSEDGRAHTWYTRSSAAYKNPLSSHCYGGKLCGVAWHQTQHVVALCSYADGSPILLLEADRDKVANPIDDQATALPEHGATKKDGKLDATAIFDGVEFTEDQMREVEAERMETRKNFATSLRESLQESNPALQRLFSSPAANGRRGMGSSLDTSLRKTNTDPDMLNESSAMERIRARRRAKKERAEALQASIGE